MEQHKAIIKTKYSEVEITSDKEIIASVISEIQRREEMRERFRESREIREKEEGKQLESSEIKDPKSLSEKIIKLKQEGFFNNRKTIGEVQKELEARGDIYPNTTLSGILLRLVKKQILGRLNETDGWRYIKR